MDFVNPLVKKYPGRPYFIVADSYYSSLELAERLHKLKLGCMLSCKSDRPSWLFSQYLHRNIKKETMHYVVNSKFSAITYYDKAKVNLLTNLFKGDKWIYNSQHTKKLPQSIYYYRKWLGPIDHFDRFLHLYLPSNRNIKWTQALLRALLKFTINNCYVIAKLNDDKTSLLEVELEVIKYLSKDHTLRNPEARPTFLQRIEGNNHFPQKIPISKHCSWCLSHLNKKSSASYECMQCKVALHAECFADYHLIRLI